MPRTQGTPQIAYHHDGARGPRVLLVMGLGMRGLVWQEQIRDLSVDHQVAWYDNRGIGESDRALRRFKMRDLAMDAVRVLDALDWPDAHVVGVSLGGMVSQELALTRPERVRSLTLIATHPGGPLGVVPTSQGVAGFIRAQLTDDRARALASLLYPPSFLRRVDRKALEDRMREQTRRQPLGTILRQLLAVVRHDTRDRLPRIAHPTLVLKPTEDILVRPLHSDRLAAGIPGARLVEVHGAGHGAIFQEAPTINREIRGHIARSESQTG